MFELPKSAYTTWKSHSCENDREDAVQKNIVKQISSSKN